MLCMHYMKEAGILPLVCFVLVDFVVTKGTG